MAKKDTLVGRVWNLAAAIGRNCHVSELLEVYNEKFPEDPKTQPQITGACNGMKTSGVYKHKTEFPEDGVIRALPHGSPVIDIEPEPKPEPKPKLARSDREPTAEQEYEWRLYNELRADGEWQEMLAEGLTYGKVSGRIAALGSYLKEKHWGADKDHYEMKARNSMIRVYGKGFL